MKRYMAILGFVVVGILAGLLVRGIPIVLHVNAGGEAVATQNGDVNGDSMLDMSDAVYLLIHLFNGGPEPIACADSDEIWDEVRAIEGEVNGLGGPLASIAQSLAYESCKNRHDRFVDNGNQTVTDRLTNLMWADNTPGRPTWEIAQREAAESSHAGHTDWRLPTAMELLSIRREVRQIYSYYWRTPTASNRPYVLPSSESNTMFYPAFSWSEAAALWSSMEFGTNAFVVNFRAGSRELGSPDEGPLAGEAKKDRFDNKDVGHGSFRVRDIGPGE